MSNTAIKRMELASELSLVPDDELDLVQAFLASVLARSQVNRSSQSLQGIWRGSGLERIDDLEAAVREARHELGAAILKRNSDDHNLR